MPQSEQLDNAAGVAIDRLWNEIIVARKPNYGDWSYPAEAYRHLKAEFDDLLADQARLMNLIILFGDPGKCKSCQADVFWIRHRTGKLGIYNADGISHFATCPFAEKYRGKKEV